MKLETEASDNRAQLIICDRGVVDIVAYSTIFNHEVRQEWIDWCTSYNRVFLFDKNDIPFTRDIIEKDEQYQQGRDWIQFREQVNDIIIDVLNDSGLEYKQITGGVNQRHRDLLAEIRSIQKGIEHYSSYKER